MLCVCVLDLRGYVCFHLHVSHTLILLGAVGSCIDTCAIWMKNPALFITRENGILCKASVSIRQLVLRTSTPHQPVMVHSQICFDYLLVI